MLDNGNGKMFSPAEAWRVEIKKRAHMLNQKYNVLTDYQVEERKEILRELLGELNENVTLAGPITFHYGRHTKIGKNTFINFNFTCQDDAEVTIGECCDFGPNVTIVTPMHPLLLSERRKLMCPDGVARRLCYAEPVRIGNGCWICANVTILPGVTIGDGCVIGAGSVVSKSIPANSLAAGNPCRVIRTLSEADSMANLPDILGDCTVIEA
jgi:maltose O-acetyltransferase